MERNEIFHGKTTNMKFSRVLNHLTYIKATLFDKIIYSYYNKAV